MLTFNAIIERFREFADAHFFIKTFSHGGNEDVDLNKATDFPLMHVIYQGATYDEGSKIYSFDVYVLDASPESLSKIPQQQNVVSDSEQVLEDILSDLVSGWNIFDVECVLESSSITPLEHIEKNVLCGAMLSVSIAVDYDHSSCFAPIDGVSPESGETSFARRGILRVREVDGSPDVLSVNEIVVSNASLEDLGEGVVRLYTGGGGIGSVTSVNNVEPVEGNVSLTTSDIPEGTRLYFTNLRVNQYLLNTDSKLINFGDNKGILAWDDDDKTLQITYGSTGVSLQIGQEQHFYAKATEAISDGDIVMFAGAQGSHLLISKADMNSVGFKPEYVIGVATQDFALNEFGYVTAFGKVRGLDLSAYQDGDLIYLSSTTAGAYTTTEPTPPAHIILVAAVAYAHAQQGTLFVRPSHKPDTDEIPEGTNKFVTAAQKTTIDNLQPVATSGDYNDLTNLPAIPQDADDIAPSATRIWFTPLEQLKLQSVEWDAEENVNADWNATSGDAQILNKPTIPVNIGDLADVETTMGTAGQVLAVNAAGNALEYVAQSGGTGSVNSVTGTAPIVITGTSVDPVVTITTATTSADGAMSSSDKLKLDGIAAGAEVNVQSDWNATSGDAYILNKPAIPKVFTDLADTPSTLGGALEYARTNQARTAIEWSDTLPAYGLAIIATTLLPVTSAFAPVRPQVVQKDELSGFNATTGELTLPAGKYEIRVDLTARRNASTAVARSQVEAYIDRAGTIIYHTQRVMYIRSTATSEGTSCSIHIIEEITASTIYRVMVGDSIASGALNDITQMTWTYKKF